MSSDFVTPPRSVASSVENLCSAFLTNFCAQALARDVFPVEVASPTGVTLIANGNGHHETLFLSYQSGNAVAVLASSSDSGEQLVRSYKLTPLADSQTQVSVEVSSDHLGETSNNVDQHIDAELADLAKVAESLGARTPTRDGLAL